MVQNVELDGLEADMGMETESDSVPAYLQPEKEPDLDAELNFPSAPSGHGTVPPSRQSAQVYPLFACTQRLIIQFHCCMMS